MCLAGSGKHSCQARSSQHSNYKPDLIVKDFTVTLLMFALEKKVFSLTALLNNCAAQILCRL